jgi:hypothetical protein
MAIGKMSHDWDLFAPLMCFVANPYMKSGKGITVCMIHPFKNDTRKLKFNKKNWNALKQGFNVTNGE